MEQMKERASEESDRTDRFTSTKEDFVFVTEEELKKMGFVPYEAFQTTEESQKDDSANDKK